MTIALEPTPARREQWSSSGYLVVREAFTARQLEAARQDALSYVPDPSSAGPGQVVEHPVAAIGELAQLTAPLAAEFLGADGVAVSGVVVRAAYGVTRDHVADTLSSSSSSSSSPPPDGAGAGRSLRFLVYLTDVTLNDGPLFLVSAGAAHAHVSAGAADRTAHLWEVPVCAPAGTAILYRPDLLTRLANRRVGDGWQLTAHATFTTTTAPGERPVPVHAGDAFPTTYGPRSNRS